MRRCHGSPWSAARRRMGFKPVAFLQGAVARLHGSDSFAAAGCAGGGAARSASRAAISMPTHRRSSGGHPCPLPAAGLRCKRGNQRRTRELPDGRPLLHPADRGGHRVLARRAPHRKREQRGRDHAAECGKQQHTAVAQRRRQCGAAGLCKRRGCAHDHRREARPKQPLRTRTALQQPARRDVADDVDGRCQRGQRERRWCRGPHRRPRRSTAESRSPTAIATNTPRSTAPPATARVRRAWRAGAASSRRAAGRPAGRGPFRAAASASVASVALAETQHRAMAAVVPVRDRPAPLSEATARSGRTAPPPATTKPASSCDRARSSRPAMPERCPAAYRFPTDPACCSGAWQEPVAGSDSAPASMQAESRSLPQRAGSTASPDRLRTRPPRLRSTT